mgnify:FL=1
MSRYESDAYELRSCDLAVHFYRRARMNGPARRPGLLDRLRVMVARREPPATICECCGAPLDDLELAHGIPRPHPTWDDVVVQAGRVCRRCEAGR